MRFGVAVLGLVLPALLWAQEPGAHVPGHVLVRVRPGLLADVAASAVSGRRARTFGSGAELWEVPDADAAIATLRERADVLWAEPDVIMHIDSLPRDPQVANQWEWTVIHAPEAWDRTTGSRSVIVADTDTGIALSHPDLMANIWTNAGEVPGDGLDNDGDGLADDVHGYDFYNEAPDPVDQNGHGTHTAGTIGAVAGNGIGLTGMSPLVTIMPLKFLGPCGGGATSDGIRAIDYAREHGAVIINASWGCGISPNCFSQALYDAIALAQRAGILFVASAGNNNANTDLQPYQYPADFDLPNILTVGASTQVKEGGLPETRAAYSNWGPKTVDVFAPGDYIWSTYDGVPEKFFAPWGGYVALSGTSMAAPHVAGLAALVKALHPDWSYYSLKSVIRIGVDVVPGLTGLSGFGGRINARKTVCFQGGC